MKATKITETNLAYRLAAQRIYMENGDCTVEIDDNASVSKSVGNQDGAYVQGWVWVPASEAAKERATWTPNGGSLSC